MVIDLLIAILGSFLIASLVSAPLRDVSVMLRLLLAFLVWGMTMALYPIANSGLEPGETPADPILAFIRKLPWYLPYFVALGTFLGTGARWWTGAWWRNPFAFVGNFELRFAARITFKAQRSISNLVVRLGILSILLGVAVMEVSISIVFGFETAIQEKVIGFGSHVHIGNLLEEHESEVLPIPMDNEFIPAIAAMPSVRNVSPYILRPTMLKSKLTQEGIVLKGVDSTYDWDFFQASLQRGTVPDVTKGKQFSQDLLISVKMANVLDLDTGDRAFAYFFEPDAGTARVRQFNVTGIYETGLGEFDQTNAFCDLRALRKIWRWDSNQVMGFEVWLDDIQQLSEIDPAVAEMEDVLREHDAFLFEPKSITSEYPELFEWVALQHQNVWFILILMVIIAVINMVSVILILILERTRTIGLLKALGMNNRRMQDLFVTNAMFLILIGLALGNLVGLGLIWSQDIFGWLVVDQESYFVHKVPVQWKWEWFLAVNFGVLGVCTFFMYLPAWMVTRISPVKALRFE
jgi:lipoprotein-releasing system permease protein